MGITLSDIQNTGLPQTEHGAIAAALSAGRTKLVPTEVGNGTILETLGLTSGNALLDAIAANAEFRHVKPLLEQGRLRIDSTLVRSTLDLLAGQGVITAAEANLLKGLAEQPDVVTVAEVISVLRG